MKGRLPSGRCSRKLSGGLGSGYQAVARSSARCRGQAKRYARRRERGHAGKGCASRMAGPSLVALLNVRSKTDAWRSVVAIGTVTSSTTRPSERMSTPAIASAVTPTVSAELRPAARQQVQAGAGIGQRLE